MGDGCNGKAGADLGLGLSQVCPAGRGPGRGGRVGITGSNKE